VRSHAVGAGTAALGWLRGKHEEAGAALATAEPAASTFAEWYASLDDVLETATTTDPELVRRLRQPYLLDDRLVDNACEDKDANCSWWASIGECQNNPAYVFRPEPALCPGATALFTALHESTCWATPSVRIVVRRCQNLNRLGTAGI